MDVDVYRKLRTVLFKTISCQRILPVERKFHIEFPSIREENVFEN